MGHVKIKLKNKNWLSKFDEHKIKSLISVTAE